MRFVGLDIGKWKCRAAIMNQEGVILDEFTFTNNHEGIEGLASRLTLQDRVVMESTGSVWTNLYDRLDDRHIRVSLANPLKTKAIASAKIKSDKVVARILAHLLRSNLVAESYVPGKPLREIRALIGGSLVPEPCTVQVFYDIWGAAAEKDGGSEGVAKAARLRSQSEDREEKRIESELKDRKVHSVSEPKYRCESPHKQRDKEPRANPKATKEPTKQSDGQGM
jgi:hypothetical protein